MKLTSIPTINPLIHEYEKLLIVASVHEKFHCICSCASKLPGTVCSLQMCPRVRPIYIASLPLSSHAVMVASSDLADI